MLKNNMSEMEMNIDDVMEAIDDLFFHYDVPIGSYDAFYKLTQNNIDLKILFLLIAEDYIHISIKKVIEVFKENTNIKGVA